MFGLLKQRSTHPDHRSDYRRSYCGTCKAIGKIYGHKERLFLNYDVVFLSELLAELSGSNNDFDGISVNRCFSLPKQQNDIPDFLVYTASVNLLLANIKLQDQMEDSRTMAIAWRAVARLQQKKFAKARLLLQHRGLQMSYVDGLVQEQFRREKHPLHFTDIGAECSFYSEMTGLLTGEIFRQAANTVSKPEVADILYKIGKAYGEIVYLVDALKDHEKDKKRGAFNLLHSYTTNKDGSLSPAVVAEVHTMVAANVDFARKQIFELPLTIQKMHFFASRLETAVHAATQASHSCLANAVCHAPRMSIPQKYRLVYNRAKMALAPTRRNTVRLAGTAVAAGFIALVLLAWPLRVDASLPSSTPPNQCSQDIADCCCQCCCDACCEEMCNAKN